MRFQLRARTGHPDFLDLPWEQRLEEWDHPRLVEIPRGLHRHVVRTVQYGEQRYYLKALPPRLAEREWRFLRHLATEGVPVVDVVGVVRDRHAPDGSPLPSVLVTAELEYGLPYRLLFLREHAQALADPMLDALVDLLVRIHLVGFHWGDCSLSNTLFRRDADRLAAYLVDTETGELHAEGLTDGQRAYDLDLAVERCAGELFDLIGAGVLSEETDVAALADELRLRYGRLWSVLTLEEEFDDDERWRINDRLRRINHLGYDVEELEIDRAHQGDGHRLRLRTRVVEPGHHRRRLLELTGVVAGEQQARSLLRDLDAFGVWLREFEGVSYSDEYAAHRWVENTFNGILRRVPQDVRGRREPAQIVHEALEHWLAMCRASDQQVSLWPTIDAYVAGVLDRLPSERVPSSLSDRELELLTEDDASDAPPAAGLVSRDSEGDA